MIIQLESIIFIGSNLQLQFVCLCSRLEDDAVVTNHSSQPGFGHRMPHNEAGTTIGLPHWTCGPGPAFMGLLLSFVSTSWPATGLP